MSEIVFSKDVFVGRSSCNAMKAIKNNSINFKNYDYFYHLTYSYNYDIRVILNNIYMDFTCFAINNGEADIESDNIIIHNVHDLIVRFIDLSLPTKKKQNFSALLGIFDLLSDTPKPGKFTI